MILEQIVKKDAPFCGEHNRGGFDVKGRIKLPDALLDTLKDRQQVASNRRINLYYRLHSEESPPYVELTDYFEDDANTDFSKYMRVAIDEHHRFSIGAKNSRISGVDEKRVMFVGEGNNILIYNLEDYKNMQKPGYGIRRLLSVVKSSGSHHTL